MGRPWGDHWATIGPTLHSLPATMRRPCGDHEVTVGRPLHNLCGDHEVTLANITQALWFRAVPEPGADHGATIERLWGDHWTTCDTQ